MKKKWLVISLLAIAALALTGCAQQTPAAAPAAVTEQPAAQTAETAEIAAETAVETAETAAETAETAAETAETAAETAEAVQPLELTVEELARYNGQNGERAYVAVDGVIYDMTDSPAWKGGAHNGFEAGKDLTEAIKTKSPHGVAKLGNVPVVGTLKAE